MRQIKQTPAFGRKYKKLKKHDRKILNDVIEYARKNPENGDSKKGDLSGYLTWTFKLHGGQCRLLYCYDADTITLVEFGPRENFYR